MPPFDRLVLTVLAALAAAVVTLGVIGDRVGVRVSEVWPPDDADLVSTLVRPRIVFDQPVVPAALPSGAAAMPVRLVPETPVELIWSTRTVTLRPRRPLQRTTTYTLYLEAGLAGAQGRRLLRPRSWQFTTAPLRVMYLGPDAAGRDQLFSAGLTGTPLQVTDRPDGVWDYHVAQDGSAVVYSAPRDQAGNDLFVVDIAGGAERRLLDCRADHCFGPRWAPGGGAVAFARRTLPAPPRVYLIDRDGGRLRPVLEDASFVGFEPRWAPDGESLAWVAPLENGVRVVQLRDGASAFIPSRTGEPPVWSPDGGKLVVTDVQVDDPHFRTRLVTLDVPSLTLERPWFAGAGTTRDEEWGLRWAPPDGARVSLLRRPAGAGGGGQVWLLERAGSAQQLTDDAAADHGAAQWSADGRYLAFHRIPLETADSQSEIVVWDTARGAAAGRPLTGRSPGWLP